MVQIIPAEVILANLCACNFMTIKVYDLSMIRRKLESEFDNIYCEIDTDSTLCAISEWRDYFMWEPNQHIECLVKLNSAYVDKYFNWRIEEDKRKRFVEIIKEYVKEKDILSDK